MVRENQINISGEGLVWKRCNAGQDAAITYLLLTEFEVLTVSYGPSLWPKREALGP